MTTTAPRLRDGLEVLTGMDEMTLIFDPVSGAYHRVSRSGGVLLAHLDGAHSVDDLTRLADPTGADLTRRTQFRTQLDGFLDHLDRSGLLAGSEPPAPTAEKRAKTSRMMPRVVVSRSLPRLLEPLAARLRGGLAPVLAWIAAALAVAGFAAGFGVLFTHGGVSVPRSGLAFALAAVLQLVLILLHESSHALVAQVLKVPVRGLGFAMLFWFMPVAYVDRTDAYRLRGRRGRVALALAGMGSDGVWTGVVGGAALLTDGFWQHTFLLLLTLQLIGLMVNLNPLLPSDGYSALEAASGQVDYRGRAFGLVGSVLARRPRPSYLRGLPTRRAAGYTAYAVGSAGYVLLVAAMLVLGIANSVAATLAGVR
jgi:putative peptide zinc metalloprotease protein